MSRISVSDDSATMTIELNIPINSINRIIQLSLKTCLKESKILSAIFNTLFFKKELTLQLMIHYVALLCSSGDVTVIKASISDVLNCWFKSPPHSYTCAGSKRCNASQCKRYPHQTGRQVITALPLSLKP